MKLATAGNGCGPGRVGRAARAAFLTVCAVVTPVLGADGTALSWDWSKADGATYVLTETSKQKHVGPAGVMNRETSVEVTLRVEVEEVLDSGAAEAVVHVSRVRASVEMDQTDRRSYDSGEGRGFPADDEALALLAWAGALADHPLEVVLEGSGGVSRMRNFESMREDVLDALEPKAAELLGDRLESDVVAGWLTGALGGLPGRAVEIGETWEELVLLPSEGFGEIQMVLEHRFAGEESGTATVRTSGRVKLDFGPLGAPFEATKRSITGEIAFDAGEGSIRSRSRTVWLELEGEVAANQRMHAEIRRETSLRRQN